MSKGYVILTESIHDPDGLAAYGRAAGGSLAEHGASVLVVEENVEVRGWVARRSNRRARVRVRRRGTPVVQLGELLRCPLAAAGRGGVPCGDRVGLRSVCRRVTSA